MTCTWGFVMGSPLPAVSLPACLSSFHHSHMLGHLLPWYQAATKLMSVYDEAEIPRALMGHLMGLLLCSQWKHLRRPLQRAVLALKSLKNFPNQCVNLRHSQGPTAGRFFTLSCLVLCGGYWVFTVYKPADDDASRGHACLLSWP